MFQAEFLSTNVNVLCYVYFVHVPCLGDNNHHILQWILYSQISDGVRVGMEILNMLYILMLHATLS
jgi:hypothetical protein